MNALLMGIKEREDKKNENKKGDIILIVVVGVNQRVAVSPQLPCKANVGLKDGG